MNKIWHFIAEIKINPISQGGRNITLEIDYLPIEIFVKNQYYDSRMLLPNDKTVLANHTYKLKIAVLYWDKFKDNIDMNNTYKFKTGTVKNGENLGVLKILEL